MHSQQGGHHRHNFRFYLVMITLVALGVFVLLLMNDQQGGFDFTSAFIGTSTQEEILSPDTMDDQMIVGTTAPSKNLAIDLSFDGVPKVSTESKVKEIEIKFNNLVSSITINNNKLELNNLEEVHLLINGFVGDLNFDEAKLNLDGSAQRIEINGIALSSHEEIQISFKSLEYNYLNIDELELENLQFPKGEGELKVAEKLSYKLSQDQLVLSYFKGGILFEGGMSSEMSLQGVARGIKVSGEDLDLNLK